MHDFARKTSCTFIIMGNFYHIFSSLYTDVSYIILLFVLMHNLLYILQIPFAFSEIFSPRLYSANEHSWWLMTSKIAKSVTIVMPAYNEAVGIVNSVNSILSVKYPNFEVIVVNDGSPDDTMKVLQEEFNLFPTKIAHERDVPHQNIRGVYRSRYYDNLVIIDKENGGKADALNAGINFSKSELVCVIDADSIIETESLLKAVQPFIDDHEVIAVGGTIIVGNGCVISAGEIKKVGLPSSLLPLFQTSEYIRSFLIGRVSASKMGIVTIISGAFGVFNREALKNVNGFTLGIIGEDHEMVLKLHRYFLEHNIPYKIKAVAEPICWTEAPNKLSVLASQRMRWQQGALEGFFAHLKVLFNPRYKKLGMISFPLILIFDILSPIIEMLGYIMIPLGFIFGLLDTEVVLLFVLIFFFLGILISVFSLIAKQISSSRFHAAQDLGIITLIAVFENFGYRQINSFWRIKGWINFIMKKKAWGNMVRTGYRSNIEIK